MKVYNCKFCDLDYNIRRDWKRHILQVHGIQSYGCDTCPETFYEEKDLLEHVDAAHDGQVRHPCPHCSMSYKKSKDLDAHIHYKHTIDDMVSCEKCGEEFHNNVAYKRHLQLQHKPGLVYHKCKSCTRSFRYKHHLKLHQDFDHAKNGRRLLLQYIKELKVEKGVLGDVSQCKVCKIRFNCSLDLIQHLKLNHTKKKIFACCQCTDAVYYTRASLGIHMRHEHGLLSHSCSKCPAPQRPSKTAPLKPKKLKVKKHKTRKTRDKFNSVLTLLTNKNSENNGNQHMSVSKAPWADRFINENLPSDLELKNASEQELKNLSHNIKTVFNILSTVAPSRLKASQGTHSSKRPRIIGRNMNIVSFMFPPNHPVSRTPTLQSKPIYDLLEPVVEHNKHAETVTNEFDSNVRENIDIEVIHLKNDVTLGFDKTEFSSPSVTVSTAKVLRPKNVHTQNNESYTEVIKNKNLLNILENNASTRKLDNRNTKKVESPGIRSSESSKLSGSIVKLSDALKLSNQAERSVNILESDKFHDGKQNVVNQNKGEKEPELLTSLNITKLTATLDFAGDIEAQKNVLDDSKKKKTKHKNSHKRSSKEMSVKTKLNKISGPKAKRSSKNSVSTRNKLDTKPTLNSSNPLSSPNLNSDLNVMSDEANICDVYSDDNNLPKTIKIKSGKNKKRSSRLSKKLDVIAQNESSQSSNINKKYENPINNDISATNIEISKIDRPQCEKSKCLESSLESFQDQETMTKTEEIRNKVTCLNNCEPKVKNQFEANNSPEKNMDVLISLQLTKKMDAYKIPKIKVRDFSKKMPELNAISSVNSDPMSSQEKFTLAGKESMVSDPSACIAGDICPSTSNLSVHGDSDDTIAQIEAFLAMEGVTKIDRCNADKNNELVSNPSVFKSETSTASVSQVLTSNASNNVKAAEVKTTQFPSLPVPTCHQLGDQVVLTKNNLNPLPAVINEETSSLIDILEKNASSEIQKQSCRTISEETVSTSPSSYLQKNDLNTPNKKEPIPRSMKTSSQGNKCKQADTKLVSCKKSLSVISGDIDIGTSLENINLPTDNAKNPGRKDQEPSFLPHANELESSSISDKCIKIQDSDPICEKDASVEVTLKSQSLAKNPTWLGVKKETVNTPNVTNLNIEKETASLKPSKENKSKQLNEVSVLQIVNFVNPTVVEGSSTEKFMHVDDILNEPAQVQQSGTSKYLKTTDNLKIPSMSNSNKSVGQKKNKQKSPGIKISCSLFKPKEKSPSKEKSGKSKHGKTRQLLSSQRSYFESRGIKLDDNIKIDSKSSMPILIKPLLKKQDASRKRKCLPKNDNAADMSEHIKNPKNEHSNIEIISKSPILVASDHVSSEFISPAKNELCCNEDKINKRVLKVQTTEAIKEKEIKKQTTKDINEKERTKPGKTLRSETKSEGVVSTPTKIEKSNCYDTIINAAMITSDNTSMSPSNNLNKDEVNVTNINKSPSFQDVFIQEIFSNPSKKVVKKLTFDIEVAATKPLTEQPISDLKTIDNNEKVIEVTDNTEQIITSITHTSLFSNDKGLNINKIDNSIASTNEIPKQILVQKPSPSASDVKISTLSNKKYNLGSPLKRVIILPKLSQVKPTDNDRNNIKTDIKPDQEESLKNVGHLPKSQSKKAIVIRKDMIIRTLKEPLQQGDCITTIPSPNKIPFSASNACNLPCISSTQSETLNQEGSSENFNESKIPKEMITTNMITPLDLVNIHNGIHQVNSQNVVPLPAQVTDVKQNKFFGVNKNLSKLIKIVLQRVNKKVQTHPRSSNFPLISDDGTKNDENISYNNFADGITETEFTLSVDSTFCLPENQLADEDVFQETELNDSMEVANYVDIVTSSPNLTEVPILSESPALDIAGREYNCKFCCLKCNDEIILLNHLTEMHAYGNEEDFEMEQSNTLYKCGTCGDGFSLKDSLDKHAKEEHGDGDSQIQTKSNSDTIWNSVVCNICEAVLKNQKEQNDHECSTQSTPTRANEPETLSSKCIGEMKNSISRKSNCKTYKCDECNIKFKSGLLLYNHNRKRHSDPIYNCDACCGKFWNKRNYLRHKCKPAPILCKKCKITFTSKELLLEHKKEQHNMGSLKCEYCPKYFKTNQNLMKHTTAKHFKTTEYRNLGLKPSKQGKKSRNLQMSDIYNDLKIINQASDGPYVTRLVSNLSDKHLTINEKAARNGSGKNKKSTSIDKTCGRPSSEHQCNNCKLNFNSKNELLLHSNIHKALKRFYKCLKCPKKFALKTSLLKHIKYEHNLEPNKIYRCQYCCAVFKFEDKLEQHYKFKHSPVDKKILEMENRSVESEILEENQNIINPIESFTPDSDSTPKNKPVITSHIVFTPEMLNGQMFRCGECNAYLPSVDSLNRHILLEHQKEHRCGQCDQVFLTTETFWQHLVEGHGNANMKEMVLPSFPNETAPENSIKWKTQLVHNYKRQRY